MSSRSPTLRNAGPDRRDTVTSHSSPRLAAAHTSSPFAQAVERGAVERDAVEFHAVELMTVRLETVEPPGPQTEET